MLPRITIVTPSFNQGSFIEETIRSVLDQGYPNLEYIVIDGGSTDGTLDILRRYEDRIDYWVSEPDGGQAEAIAKGFARATGDVLGWLCSDDLLKPGALAFAGSVFQLIPGLDLVYGDTEYLYPDGSRDLKPRIGWHFDTMLYAFNLVPQPSSFFSRRAFDRAGGMDASFHYAMDYDLFLRFGRDAIVRQFPVLLSTYRIHAVSKTASQADRFMAEWIHAQEKVLLRPKTRIHRALRYVWLADVVRRFRTERGIWKLRYDRKKYSFASTGDVPPSPQG